MIQITSNDADMIMFKMNTKGSESGCTIQGALNQVLERTELLAGTKSLQQT